MHNKLNESQFGNEFALLVAAVNDLGFDGVLYSYYPRPLYLNKKVQPMLHYCETFAPFVAHYIENDYGNRDFVLRMSLEQKNTAIIDWWKEIDAGYVSAAEQAVTRDARENFDIKHGISVPAMSGTFAIAGLSVISKTNDRDAFNALKVQHEAELFNFLASRLNTLEDAEDLIQELFIRLLQQGEKFCSIKQPRAWLYQVARNALIDRYRKQRAFVDLDEKQPDTLFSEGLISEPFISEELNPAVMDLLDRCLWRNLEELPPEELAIIRQCDLNGMRQKTFAQHQQTVRSMP